jgi:hypothetical protein
MPENCPGRSSKNPGLCRPDLWSDDSQGFIVTIVMQCVFCKRQVRYGQLIENVLEVEDADRSNVSGRSSDRAFSH